MSISNPLLNSQVCLNCQHMEMWHNEIDDEIRCVAWVTSMGQMSYDASAYGSELTRCTCKDFKMDNLKYLEKKDELKAYE